MSVDLICSEFFQITEKSKYSPVGKSVKDTKRQLDIQRDPRCSSIPAPRSDQMLESFMPKSWGTATAFGQSSEVFVYLFVCFIAGTISDVPISPFQRTCPLTQQFQR